ncbi:MAG: lipoate--protein ligase family protein, partial [Nitrospinota bacterium]
WRLIKDGFNEGYHNMVVDEAIACAVENRVSPPTLRLYSWKTQTLSIGYSQRIDKEIDTSYCQREGIDIVLRPTGGRAVLHDKEVTYSIASTKDNTLFPDSILETYRVISNALVRGLSLLKINATLNPKSQISRPTIMGAPKSQILRPSCFATTSQYEIVVHGKKLIGSAQRRFKMSFLQQGSIPLENYHDKLALCLGFKEKEKRERFVELLKKRSTALNELDGKIFSYDKVVNAIINGFEDIFKIKFDIAPLTAYELELSDKLYERKKVF